MKEETKAELGSDVSCSMAQERCAFRYTAKRVSQGWTRKGIAAVKRRDPLGKKSWKVL